MTGQTTMLEKLPSAVGEALQGVRAGLDKTVGAERFASVPRTLSLTSADFAAEGPIPSAHTADGAGTPPVLRWSGCPAGTAELVLIVEDADSPTPRPLVHLIAYGLPAEGGFDGGAAMLGTNSFGKAGWLPPDPPSGHGAHRYVFQLFALREPSGLAGQPGRGALVDAIEGRALAQGVLVGTYERP